MIIRTVHGGGGRATQELVEKIFAKHFDSPVLKRMEDAAVIDVQGRIAMTTDSYVITPIFFPGGDIGKVAVCGTVNDLSMMGAKPRALTVGFILEEGLLLSDLEKVVISMAETAKQAGVEIVAGDTKVIEGKGGLYINTAGLGEVPQDCHISIHAAKEKDVIIISGEMGEHAACILSSRMGIENQLKSDVAPLCLPVRSLLDAGIEVHTLRDITRGGLAAALCDLSRASGCNVVIEEARIPVRPSTRALCDLLGLDVLSMANEGKFMAVLPESQAEKALAILRQTGQCPHAAIIGKVEDKNEAQVVMNTSIGGQRFITMPWGEGLPRIC